MNSMGTTEEKYADYLESIDAKINKLITTWETMVNNFNGSELFGDIVDIGTELIGILDFLINDLKVLHGIGAIAVVSSLVIAGNKITKTYNSFKEFFDLVKEISNVSDMTKLGKSMQNLDTNTKVLLLSTKALTKEQQIQALRAAGVNQNVEKLVKNNTLLKASQARASLATKVETQAVKENTIAENQNTVADTKQIATEKTKQSMRKKALGAVVSETQAVKKNTIAENQNTVADIKQIATEKTKQKAISQSTTELNKQNVATKSNTNFVKTLANSALGLISANPIGAVLTVLTVAFTAYSMITDSIEAKLEEIVNKANEVEDTFNSLNAEINDNIKQVESLENEYNDLAKGVDKFGRNLSLSADEYDRYKNIVEELIDYAPEIQNGYIAENGLIAEKNSLIEQTIALLQQEEQANLKRRTTYDNSKAVVDAIALEHGEIEDAQSLSWENFFQDLGKDAELFAKETGLSVTDINSSILQSYADISGMNIVDLGKIVGNPKDDKYLEVVKGIVDNRDVIMNELNQLSDGKNFPTTAMEAYTTQTEILSNELDILSQRMSDELWLFAQSKDAFLELSDSQQKVLEFYSKGIDTSKFIKEDFWGNKVVDEDALYQARAEVESFVNDIHNLSPEALIDLENFVNLDADTLSAKEWQEMGNDLFDKIFKELQIEDKEIQTQIKFSFGIDTQQLESIIPEIQTQFRELTNLFLSSDYLNDLSFEDLQLTLNNIDWFAHIKDASEFTAELERLKTTTYANIYSIETFTDALSATQSAFDTAVSAMEEYNENGYLSINTLNDLLSMGDEYLALLIDENGQLQLNKEGFIEIAKAQLEETKANYENQQAKLINEFITNKLAEATALANAEEIAYQATQEGSIESLTALATAEARLAQVRANGSITDADWEEFQNSDAWKATEAGIGAVDSAILGLGESFSSVSSDSSSTTDTWKEEFDSLYADLQYQRDMDIIDSEEYYRQLALLNQKYFAGNENYIDEYRQYNKELYDGITQMAEDAAQAKADAEKEAIDEKIEALEKEKEALQEVYDEED